MGLRPALLLTKPRIPDDTEVVLHFQLEQRDRAIARRVLSRQPTSTLVCDFDLVLLQRAALELVQIRDRDTEIYLREKLVHARRFKIILDLEDLAAR